MIYSVGEQLYHFCQGSMSVDEYALQFRTLAAASGWKGAPAPHHLSSGMGT